MTCPLCHSLGSLDGATVPATITCPGRPREIAQRCPYRRIVERRPQRLPPRTRLEGVTFDEFAVARLPALLRYAVMLVGDPNLAEDLLRLTH